MITAGAQSQALAAAMPYIRTGAKDRGAICALRQEGFSFAEIGERLTPPRHKNTVRDAFLREEEDKGAKKPRGRPCTLSATTKRRIIRETRVHGEKTYAEIRVDLNLSCSPSAVNKIAASFGFKQLRQPHKGDLSPSNIAKRLLWCQLHAGKSEAWWVQNIHLVGDGTRFTKGVDDRLSRAGLAKGSKKRLPGEGRESSSTADFASQPVGRIQRGSALPMIQAPN